MTWEEFEDMTTGPMGTFCFDIEKFKKYISKVWRNSNRALKKKESK